MQAFEQVVAARARPALRPRFLDLGAVGLSRNELGDFASMSLSLGSCSAAEYGAELEDAFEFGGITPAFTCSTLAWTYKKLAVLTNH